MVQRRNTEALDEILTVHDGMDSAIGTHGTALSSILNYYDPEFGYDDLPRIIDWMPYVIELDFKGRQSLSAHEHVHIEKTYLKG